MNGSGTPAGRRRATVTDAMERLPGPAGERFAEVLEHGSMEVEIYAPRGTDPQTPHTRDELYVVVSGRATFTVEGESFDAPAGTCVLALPGERREARAEEPGTTVLVVGAPAGEAYRVAPWEYGSRAARAAQLRDVDELERVAEEGVAAYGEHVTMLYARACVAAQRGRREEALQYLDRAAHDEDFGEWVREQAPSEPLLEPIRDDPAFLR